MIGMAGMPGLQAAERAYGALFDALGFGPLRAFAEATEALMAAQVQEASAQLDFAQCVASAWPDGTVRLLQRLAQMHERGEELRSPIGLLRTYATELDAAMHDVMLSDRGLQATAAAVRAITQRRIEAQRVVALVGEACGQPTRPEIDEVHREVQELKREVRRLRHALRRDEADR